MDLSIIIVSYNEEEYLSAAIESCLSQQGDFTYEIIIGDDGSSDGSLDVIKEYAQRYPDVIRYFVVDRSGVTDVIASLRVSHVIQEGFSRSTGKYLCVLSADDLFLNKGKNAAQIAFLVSHPEYAACYVDYQEFWPSGETRDYRYKGDLPSSQFFALSYVHISCFVFRRSVLRHVLPHFCDDSALMFSILKTGQTKHLDLLGFGYRQRDTSIMHSSDGLDHRLLACLVFQEMLNAGGLKASVMSYFWPSLHEVYLRRNELGQPKLRKYISFEDGNNLICSLRKKPPEFKVLEWRALVCFIWFHFIKIVRRLIFGSVH